MGQACWPVPSLRLCCRRCRVERTSRRTWFRYGSPASLLHLLNPPAVRPLRPARSGVSIRFPRFAPPPTQPARGAFLTTSSTSSVRGFDTVPPLRSSTWGAEIRFPRFAPPPGVRSRYVARASRLLDPPWGCVPRDYSTRVGSGASGWREPVAPTKR